MNEICEKEVTELYLNFLRNRDFPCVAAREAAARQQVVCFVAGHMACPRDDSSISHFLYKFVDEFRGKRMYFILQPSFSNCPLFRMNKPSIH